MSRPMKPLKLYIETSVWNYYFADDTPEKRDITKSFFGSANKTEKELFVSDIVLKELNATPDDQKRKTLFNLMDTFKPEILPFDGGMETLAQHYIAERIVTIKKADDARHVACATVNELDALITWNYRHLANLRRGELFHAISLKNGYFKHVALITPMEVLDEEYR